MRLFVALQLPSEITDRAAALLPPALPAVRPVRPELMHLTLAFVGWTPADRLAPIIEATRTAAAGRAPFDLELRGTGRFPPRGKPRAVWLGVGLGRDQLAALAEALGIAVREAAVKFDDRQFAPHLTLARVRPSASGAEGRTIAAAVEALEVPPDLRVRVDRVAVMESVLSPRGPRYTVREDVPFGQD